MISAEEFRKFDILIVGNGLSYNSAGSVPSDEPSLVLYDEDWIDARAELRAKLSCSVLSDFSKLICTSFALAKNGSLIVTGKYIWIAE